MDHIVILFAAGLFTYWLSRSWLLAFGQDHEIDAALDGDYWAINETWIALRTLFASGLELRSL